MDPLRLASAFAIGALAVGSIQGCRTGCDLTGEYPSEPVIEWSISTPTESTSGCQIARPDGLDAWADTASPLYSDVVLVHANIGDEITVQLADRDAVGGYNGLCSDQVNGWDTTNSAAYCGFHGALGFIRGCDGLASASEPVELVSLTPGPVVPSPAPHVYMETLVLKVVGFGVVHLRVQSPATDSGGTSVTCASSLGDAGETGVPASDSSASPLPDEGAVIGVMTIVAPTP